MDRELDGDRMGTLGMESRMNAERTANEALELSPYRALLPVPTRSAGNCMALRGET